MIFRDFTVNGFLFWFVFLGVIGSMSIARAADFDNEAYSIALVDYQLKWMQRELNESGKNDQLIDAYVFCAYAIEKNRNADSGVVKLLLEFSRRNRKLIQFNDPLRWGKIVDGVPKISPLRPNIKSSIQLNITDEAKANVRSIVDIFMDQIEQSEPEYERIVAIWKKECAEAK